MSPSSPVPPGDKLSRLTIRKLSPNRNLPRSLAKRENLTVRQLAQRLGGYSGLCILGTPGQIADEMEEWLETRGSDGFNLMFPYLPEGLDDFVDRVVPVLQRRGLFRREYEGATLRENLGLRRPESRYAPV